MPVQSVTSIDDARLRWYRGVADPALLREGGRFVAEGRAVVARLLRQSQWRVESLLVTPPALAALGPEIEPQLDRLPVFVTTRDILVALAGYNIHRGCLAIGERRPLPALDALVPPAHEPVCLLGLESLADPDNVGACFRNGAAFGVDAVVLDAASADPLYRKAIRTSMGAVLQVPFARVGSWADAVPALRQRGISVVGLTPHADAEEVTAAEGDPHAARRRVLLVGSEGHGLRPETLAACDRRVRIAMAPGVDSLNVATAAAIALHAFRGRQRM